MVRECFSLFFYNSKFLSVSGNVENIIPLTKTQDCIVISIPIRMFSVKISAVFARVLITYLPSSYPKDPLHIIFQAIVIYCYLR